MDVALVRQAAREGRVVRHPAKYHAGRHGVSMATCITALERCYAVREDRRHLDAFYALCRRGREALRVDFDVWEDEDQMLIMVVTAYGT